MTDHGQLQNGPVKAPGFWKSRTGVTFIVFLAVPAILLGFEHRFHVFTGTGLIAALLLGCIVMHFFMHGGHGGGGHGGHRDDKS